MSGAEKTPVAAGTAEKSRKAATAAGKEVVAYIGPTIPGVIAANTILNNGMTKELAAVKKEVPAVGTLIVPMGKLAQARKQMEIKDSPERICYEKVQQYLAEKKGE